IVVISALEQPAVRRLCRVRQSIAAVVAAANDYRAVLLRGAQYVEHALVDEQGAPITVHDVSDVYPGGAVILGAIDAREAFLVFVIARAAAPEIVMAENQGVVSKPNDARAAEVSSCKFRLVFDLAKGK